MEGRHLPAELVRGLRRAHVVGGRDLLALLRRAPGDVLDLALARRTPRRRMAGEGHHHVGSREREEGRHDRSSIDVGIGLLDLVAQILAEADSLGERLQVLGLDGSAVGRGGRVSDAQRLALGLDFSQEGPRRRRRDIRIAEA